MWLFKKKEYNSDEELLKHYKQSGNKELFADLFKKHVSVVYGTCLFYLQDKDEAQDGLFTMQRSAWLVSHQGFERWNHIRQDSPPGLNV